MRAAPALDRAIRFLDSRIAAARSDGRITSATLPPIRKLATDAGVSPVTMMKAIEMLRTRGLVAVVHGKPTRIHGPDDPQSASLPDSPMPSPKLWQLVKDRIARDIHGGMYNRAPVLPSIKEMAVKYGVDYRTLKKSFAELVKQDIIAPHGRSYRLVQTVLRTVPHHSVLVFIYSEQEDLSAAHHDHYLLRAIETHCMRTGLLATFIRYCPGDTSTSYIVHASGKAWHPSRTSDILGCIWVVIQESQILSDCCTTFLSLKKPIAVFDVTGVLHYPRAFFDHPLTRFFSDIDHVRPTRIVGSYLLRLGHRAIAFFSVNFSQPFARGRLEGLQKVFAEAGLPDKVKSFTMESIAERLPASGAAGHQHLLRHTLRALHKIPRISPRQLQMLSRYLHPGFQDTIDRASYLVRAAYFLESLMKQAIEDEEITAWVFDSDEAACIGLDFLNRKGIAVPGRISVVGFNNTPLALKNGLTSYYHNLDGMIPSALDYLVRPNWKGQAGENKITVFKGLIIERRTTASHAYIRCPTPPVPPFRQSS